MGTLLPRRFTAIWLLLVLLSTVVPRGTFHHCEHAHHTTATEDPAHVTGPTLYADQHCALCEAPVPWGEALEAGELPVRVVQQGTELGIPKAALLALAAPVPAGRGPPVRG